MHLKQIVLGMATCLVLSACGDGGGNTQLTEGGISGTGISFGTITGFGSIWVNGVRYDVSNARFTRDGATASGQAEYRIGEVVTIKGAVNVDGVSGKAESVEFDDILEGTVSQVSTDGKTFDVLGQTVTASALTAFYGFGELTELQVGNVVEISGYGLQGGISATSITLKQSTFAANESMLEVKGTISNVDLNAQTFQLGQLEVDYANATLELPGNAPQAGQYVEVKSNQALQGSLLVASSIEVEDERPVFGSGQELELEGVVTAFTSLVQFEVNGQPVTTTASTRFEHGIAADVKLNTLLEVDGRVDSDGVLIAEEVSLKQRSSADASELEGRITALNTATQEIMIQGEIVLVDNRTTLIDDVNEQHTSIQFADLKVNDFIEIDGSRLNDGRILALKIEREAPETDDENDKDDD